MSIQDALKIFNLQDELSELEEEDFQEFQAVLEDRIASAPILRQSRFRDSYTQANDFLAEIGDFD